MSTKKRRIKYDDPQAPLRWTGEPRPPSDAVGNWQNGRVAKRTRLDRLSALTAYPPDVLGLMADFLGVPTSFEYGFTIPAAEEKKPPVVMVSERYEILYWEKEDVFIAVLHAYGGYTNIPAHLFPYTPAMAPYCRGGYRFVFDYDLDEWRLAERRITERFSTNLRRWRMNCIAQWLEHRAADGHHLTFSGECKHLMTATCLPINSDPLLHRPVYCSTRWMGITAATTIYMDLHEYTAVLQHHPPCPHHGCPSVFRLSAPSQNLHTLILSQRIVI